MGFRARRSIKIAPGIRVNVSAKSIGVSAGVRGARVSVNTRGRVTKSVGIPGTGLSHVTTSQVGRKATGKSRTSRSNAATPVQRPTVVKPAVVKPSIFAPAWEKALFRTLSSPDAPTLHRLSKENPVAAEVISLVEVVRVNLPAGDKERAKALLGWLHSREFEPQNDAFVKKYLPSETLTVPIATGITVKLILDRSALGLMLAEMEQEDGNLSAATEVVECLEPTTVTAVSLAELYTAQSRWADVVELTNGLANEDEASTYLLIQRGVALREQGYFEAARESLKEALRPRSRPVELRQLAYIERGKGYLAEGKRAMARKDFERVLAEDSAYVGLTELLEAASN